jgi:hypothetical protein
LSQWKCKFGIKFKKASSDAVNAEEWKSTKLPFSLQKFCSDDIYSAEERGLLCHAMLDVLLSYNQQLYLVQKKQ